MGAPELKIRALNYGEYVDAMQEAQQRGLDITVCALSKALTINGRHLTPQELLNIKPFGPVLAWINEFNRINNIVPAEEKKS